MIEARVTLPDFNPVKRAIQRGITTGTKAAAERAVQVREEVMQEGIYSKPLPKGSKPRRGRNGGILGATVVRPEGPDAYTVGPDDAHEGQERGLRRTRVDIQAETARRLETDEAVIVAVEREIERAFSGL